MYKSFLSFFFAFFILIVCGRYFIALLQKWQIGQVIRTEGPKSHYNKKGTPTMGGLLIIFSIIFASLLFADWQNPLVIASLITLVAFSIIGFYDDYKKIILKNTHGLASRWKYFWQSVLALGLAFWLYHFFKIEGWPTDLQVPFDAGLNLPLPGTVFIFLVYFTIVGSSNAVNLTDGLDGLAILSSILVAAGLIGMMLLNKSLPPSLEALLPLLTALLGAGLGFWWFNGSPALIFMGDVGSLAIGALLAFIAICLRCELFFAIMGGIFILETLSVILQVGSYKLRHKKRIFKMAPLHHHFELSGWAETRVVNRFTIITFFLVAFALFAAVI